MTEMRSIVSVVFQGATKQYEYYTPHEPSAYEDKDRTMYVVVDSPHTGYVTAQVVAVKPAHAQNYNGTMKPIVCNVNDMWYRQECERKKRKALIERQLQRMAESKTKLAQFEALLGTDEEARKLIEELKSL